MSPPSGGVVEVGYVRVMLSSETFADRFLRALQRLKVQLGLSDACVPTKPLSGDLRHSEKRGFQAEDA